MIQTQFGTWIWSPYDPRPMAVIEGSPIRQLDITLAGWNILWATYPDVDLLKYEIGKEPEIFSMKPDFRIPPEFRDMLVDIRGRSIWTLDDTMQLAKLAPTLDLVRRIERFHEQHQIRISHSMYARLNLIGVEQESLPQNVVSFAAHRKGRDGQTS